MKTRAYHNTQISFLLTGRCVQMLLALTGINAACLLMPWILHFLLKPRQKGTLPLLHFLEAPVALHISYSCQEYNLDCQLSTIYNLFIETMINEDLETCTRLNSSKCLSAAPWFSFFVLFWCVYKYYFACMCVSVLF